MGTTFGNHLFPRLPEEIVCPECVMPFLHAFLPFLYAMCVLKGRTTMQLISLSGPVNRLNDVPSSHCEFGDTHRVAVDKTHILVEGRPFIFLILQMLWIHIKGCILDVSVLEMKADLRLFILRHDCSFALMLGEAYCLLSWLG